MRRKTDFMSNVQYALDDRLQGYKTYRGCEVMEVLDDDSGSVYCYIPELCYKKENKTSYVLCKNGTNYYSNIVPEEGDFLIVSMNTGNINEAFYVSFDRALQEPINNKKDKVIFEFEKSVMYYEDEKLVFENDDAKVTLKTDQIEMKVGFKSPQWLLLGEDTADWLKELIDAILDITVMTPVAESAPVSGQPANLLKFNLLKQKVDNLLSDNVKGN